MKLVHGAKKDLTQKRSDNNKYNIDYNKSMRYWSTKFNIQIFNNYFIIMTCASYGPGLLIGKGNNQNIIFTTTKNFRCQNDKIINKSLGIF